MRKLCHFVEKNGPNASAGSDVEGVPSESGMTLR